MALPEITSEANLSIHLGSLSPSTLAVLYFHTPWAAPCEQMGAVLAALASQHPGTAPPTISFVSINAEDFPDISEKYEVNSVPSVVYVKGGKTLDIIEGNDVPKVRDAIYRHAEQNIPGADPMDGVRAHARIPPPLSAVPREDVPVTATQAPITASQPTDADNPTPVASAATLTPEQSREALFARLEELVKAAPVMLFMKGTPSSPQCGFSRQLVEILRERKVRYGFFNILADEDVRQGLKEYADWPTFPQLWVDGELRGGLDIVRQEIEDDPETLLEYSVDKSSASS